MKEVTRLLLLHLMLASLPLFAGLATAEPRGRVRGRGGAAALTAFAGAEAQSDEGSANRQGKLISLFNVVQFKNAECTSTSSISGGTGTTHRNGTCYTNQECEDKGGTIQGSCAAGFGVCCVFIVDESGDTIDQNCTYIQNEGFPSAFTGTGSVTYTINKCSEDVCKLRLDFETFSIQGTGNTVEFDGAANAQTCVDTFDITTNTRQSIPQICGQNTGQHIYVDIGALASDSATLTFNFAAVANQMWEIKVSQIACDSGSSPPDGCLQWHTGLTGRFTTFNFLDTADNHLPNQDYSVCIRQEEGFCCVQYTVCADAMSWTLDTVIAGVAETDSRCETDYIAIPGSSGTCKTAGGNPNPVADKYCGEFFNFADQSVLSAPVCDCTQPFIIDVFTDDLDDAAAGASNTAQSRGTCLEWTQQPC